MCVAKRAHVSTERISHWPEMIWPTVCRQRTLVIVQRGVLCILWQSPNGGVKYVHSTLLAFPGNPRVSPPPEYTSPGVPVQMSHRPALQRSRSHTPFPLQACQHIIPRCFRHLASTSQIHFPPSPKRPSRSIDGQIKSGVNQSYTVMSHNPQDHTQM